MSGALRIETASVRRGGLEICRDVSITVPAGEITVLLGANGAGKSTLLDGVAGVLPLAGGRVVLDGRRIDALPVHRRAARGVAYVEQQRTVFARLTVAENLAVADGSPGAFARAAAVFPRLAAKRDVRAGLLSGGEQQMLLVARALATRPRFLLVDELSLGLGPGVVRVLVDALVALARDGAGILLVEQFVETALRVGTTAHVMQRGRIVRTAPCAEVLRDRASLLSPYLRGGE
ncbi:ATP-binding cassette domain-containing protein [Leucobacter allii]|uniref:ATP-binding cassette domain-containing protein n=1 Tax=Leucobacter allii TaxID=2932247 RepID=A0ABY4FMR8_9MICO|nr:ATP-binding cassette domain-containing protein [Leucobacter allii]UOQ57548.1 ATP-binding cassette domain-containing protein [Leucobacter allii]